MSLTLLTVLGTLFLLLDCITQLQSVRAFVETKYSLTILCFIMFGWYLLEACSFLKGGGRGVSGDWRREELGGVED